MYSEEEVRAKTLEYFGGDELATNVFMTKYCLKDKQGNLTELTPDDMHVLMAKEFARMEEKFGGSDALSYEEIYELLRGFNKVVPQGSPMMGIGITMLTFLSQIVLSWTALLITFLPSWMLVSTSPIYLNGVVVLGLTLVIYAHKTLLSITRLVRLLALGALLISILISVV